LTYSKNSPHGFDQGIATHHFATCTHTIIHLSHRVVRDYLRRSNYDATTTLTHYLRLGLRDTHTSGYYFWRYGLP